MSTVDLGDLAALHKLVSLFAVDLLASFVTSSSQLQAFLDYVCAERLREHLYVDDLGEGRLEIYTYSDPRDYWGFEAVQEVIDKINAAGKVVVSFRRIR